MCPHVGYATQGLGAGGQLGAAAASRHRHAELLLSQRGLGGSAAHRATCRGLRQPGKAAVAARSTWVSADKAKTHQVTIVGSRNIVFI